MKVLIIAYACDPMKGSEEGVGWGWATNIARRHDVTVLTADFNRQAIESRLAASPESRYGRIRFRYVPNWAWHYRPEGAWLRIENSPLKPLMNAAYAHWLKDAFRVARQLCGEEEFSIVHLITYVGFRFPGEFWRLGVPFVWGPIGGLANTPWRLLPLMGFTGAIYYACRNLINSAQIRVLRKPALALRAANGHAIAATSEIQSAVTRHFRARTTVICEVGPPDIEVASPTARKPGEPLRICWSARHLAGKALPLLLRALHSVPESIDWRLAVLGSGPCTVKWQKLAGRLRLDHRCSWHGWLPRDKSWEVMRRSHVFVITSLKDLTSSVSLEALALGLPVVSLDHCGFADLITPRCGIRVPVRSPSDISAALARSIQELARDEGLRSRLAKGALQRAGDYSWERKMKALDEIYLSAAQSAGDLSGVVSSSRPPADSEHGVIVNNGRHQHAIRRRVLVCGAGGFIGGHLVKRLKREGHWVRAVDLKRHEFSESPADEFIVGDLRDPGLTEAVVDGVEDVYQLAADMGGAGYIFTGEHDAAVMHNSASINLNALEAGRRAGVKRFFYSSSACIYPAYNQLDAGNPKCSEDSAYPAAPDSEYGWEKLFSERLYASYHRNYGTEIHVARFHNIFGPEGTWEGGREKAPAALCRKVAETPDGGEIEIWGDGEQTRSFLYVDECIEGIRRLMESGFSGPVNIGSEEMVTINQLASLIMDIAGKNLRIRHVNGPLGVRGRNSDNRLIRERLGWAPAVPLREGLVRTYEWISSQVGARAVATPV